MLPIYAGRFPPMETIAANVAPRGALAIVGTATGGTTPAGAHLGEAAPFSWRRARAPAPPQETPTPQQAEALHRKYLRLRGVSPPIDSLRLGETQVDHRSRSRHECGPSRSPPARRGGKGESGQAPHGTRRTSSPLLPSGPGGVHAPAHAWDLAGADRGVRPRGRQSDSGEKSAAERGARVHSSSAGGDAGAPSPRPAGCGPLPGGGGGGASLRRP